MFKALTEEATCCKLLRKKMNIIKTGSMFSEDVKSSNFIKICSYILKQLFQITKY